MSPMQVYGLACTITGLALGLFFYLWIDAKIWLPTLFGALVFVFATAYDRLR